MCNIADSLQNKTPTIKKPNRRHEILFDQNIECPDEERTAIIEMQMRSPQSTSDCHDMETLGHHNRATVLQHRSSRPGDDYHQHGPTTESPLNPKDCPSKEETAKQESNYAKDWVRIAEVFDRMFFWLFFMAVLLSTLYLFHPLALSLT